MVSEQDKGSSPGLAAAYVLVMAVGDPWPPTPTAAVPRVAA